MRFKDINNDYEYETWTEYGKVYEDSRISRRYKELKYKDFYYSRKWLDLRVKVLNHYGRMCMCCGDMDTIIQVDHIIPRCQNQKLELDFDNLQVLCIDCNMKKGIKTIDYRPDFLAIFKIPVL